MSQPCPSCPYRDGNFTEFNDFAAKLKAKLALSKPDFFECLTIRERVVNEGLETGNLACHHSTYDADMNFITDTSHYSPCQGLRLTQPTPTPK